MRALLDRTLAELNGAAPVDQSMGTLVGELHALRAAMPPHAWRQWAELQVRGHAVYPVLLEDPFVRHSAERPRGYPGDAELLDYIYESGNIRPVVERCERSGTPPLRLHPHRARARGGAAPAGPRDRGNRPSGGEGRTSAHSLGGLRPPARSAGARIPARWHAGPFCGARSGSVIARTGAARVGTSRRGGARGFRSRADPQRARKSWAGSTLFTRSACTIT